MKLKWCIEDYKRHKKEFDKKIEEERSSPHTNDMEDGDWGYILPWCFDYNNSVPLYNTRIYPEPFGTRELFIEKKMDGKFYWHHSNYSYNDEFKPKMLKKWWQFWI